MYRCAECHAPLNKFDATFNKELFPDKPLDQCKCFECTTKGQALNAIRDYERKPNFFAHVAVYIGLLSIFLIPLIILGIAKIGNSIINDEYIWYIIIEAVIIIPCLFTLFAWIFGAIEVIKTFNHDYEIGSYSTGEYETTVSSSGSLITKEKTATYGGEGCFAAICEFLFFPWWSIFHLIYRSKKIRRNLRDKCPEEIVSAYKKAIAENQKCIISAKDIEKQIQKDNEYAKIVFNTTQKYFYLGKEDLEVKQLSKIERPHFQAEINNQKHIIAIICSKRSKSGRGNNYILSNVRAIEESNSHSHYQNYWTTLCYDYAWHGATWVAKEKDKYKQKEIMKRYGTGNPEVFENINSSIYFTLHKDENDKLVGEIFIKNYELYSDNNDWISEWKEAGIEASEDELTDLYAEYL